MCRYSPPASRPKSKRLPIVIPMMTPVEIPWITTVPVSRDTITSVGKTHVITRNCATAAVVGTEYVTTCESVTEAVTTERFGVLVVHRTVTDTISVHPKKTSSSIDVRLYGSVTDVSAVQFSKAFLPRCERPSGRDRAISALHPEKPEDQILSELFGLPKVTDVSAVQFSRAKSAIDVRLLGKDRVVSAVHPENA